MINKYTPYNNHKRNFVVESDSDITGGIQGPTYVAFHILFDFVLEPPDESALVNGYDAINDLMIDGLLLDPSSKFPYAAETILGNNQNHLVYLRDFKKLLKIIQYESPWQFQDIENLKQLWTESQNGEQFDPSRHFGKDIVIECLEDRDWKMHLLADLYRNLSYDYRWQTELLNVNSRRFSCKIIIHELREFNSISSTVQQSIKNSGSPFNSPNYVKYSKFNRTKSYNDNNEVPQITPTVTLNSIPNTTFTGANSGNPSDARQAIDMEAGVMSNPFGSPSGNTFMNTLVSQVARQATSAVNRAGQNALTNLGAAAQQRISSSIQNPALRNLTEKAVNLAQNGLSNVIDSQLNPDTAGNIFGQITQGLNSSALQNAFGGGRFGGSVILEPKSLTDSDVITIKNKSNGKTEINQLMIFELKNCEFIFDDLELADQLSVKSEKIKEAKKFKFKIRVGRVHQTSLYGVYSINVQDVHELDGDSKEKNTTLTKITDEIEPYSLYTSEKYDILHKRIFPENLQLTQDRSTKAERKNLDSNFLISAVEGLVLEGASSLVNVLVSEPLSGLSDSLLDLDIGISKENVFEAKLDHELVNAEPNLTPIDNGKSIFKEDGNIIDLQNELTSEYNDVDLGHELTSEYNDVDLGHELTSEYNDVDLGHELTSEYNDVNLDHSLSHEYNDVNLDHSLSHEYNDVNLDHSLSHEYNDVNLDHSLSHEYNDVNLDHSLSHEYSGVNLDHSLSHEYNDVNLDHSLSHEYNDVNLDHSLSHEYNDVNLDHSLTHEYNDVNLDHSLSHEYNDVNLDHSLSHEYNDVNLDHSLSHEYNGVNLDHSLSHEINTLDLDNIISRPELGSIDLSSDGMTNDIQGISDSISLDNNLDIEEINSDLSVGGNLDGLLQSELSSINLEHTLLSEIGELNLENSITPVELEGINLNNTLNSDGTERINLDEVLIIPELNSNLTNTGLETPKKETLDVSNINLIPELEDLNLENTITSERNDRPNLENQLSPATLTDSSKLENSNFITGVDTTNSLNLSNEIFLSEITTPNFDSDISAFTNLNKDLSNSELSTPSSNTLNFDSKIETPNISLNTNLQNSIESNNSNTLNLNNELDVQLPNSPSFKGNLENSSLSKPSLENESIISRPEKIELQSNLQRAQLTNIDVTNETITPSVSGANLDNSINPSSVQNANTEHSISKAEVQKTGYEAKLEMLRNRTELNTRDVEISKSELTSNSSLENSIEPTYSPKNVSKPTEGAVDPVKYRQPYNILNQ